MSGDIHIFSAAPNEGIAQLAQLDSQRPPTSPVLAAEVDGRLRAALPLDGGRAIADPFFATTQLITLLELHAAQLHRPVDTRRSSRLTGLGRWMRPAWRSAT
jgi:hypothetical protein